MADGFDPCECVCSPQWAMRRLLSALRNSQQYCSDGECFADGTPPSGLPNATDQETGMFYIMIAWAIAAVVLFLMRPASLRNRGDGKPRDNHGSGPGNLPPTVQ